MGKTRKNRTKSRQRASQATRGASSSSQDEGMDVIYSEPVVRIPGGNEGSIFPRNVFTASSAASIYDEFGAKKAREREFDARSIITSISRAENRHLTKKEKRKIKHEVFAERIQTIRKQQKALKEKKKKAGKPVENMANLMDALPELSPLEELAVDIANSCTTKSAGDLMREWNARIRKQEEEELRQRSNKSLKARAKEQAQDLSIFKAILKNPDYQEDPQGTISTHVQLRVLEDARRE